MTNLANNPVKIALVVIVTLVGMATIVGSGGGGGEDDVEETPASLLPLYNFSLFRMSNSVNPMEGVTAVSDAGTFRIDPNPVQGTFSCDTVTDVCELATIGGGTFLNVYDESPTQVTGNIGIQILQPVVFAAGSDFPTSGTVQIFSPDPPAGLGLGFLELQITTCPGGAGVQIVDNATPVGCYAWEAFEELFDTSADQVEQLASFGHGTVDFLFSLVEFAVSALENIGEYEETLQFGMVGVSCDAFSSEGSTPPVSVPDQGMFFFSWTDANADTLLNAGDNFDQSFDNCWINDPTDNIDTLVNGTVDFVNYEDVESNDVVTRLGFEPYPVGTDGGVWFTNLIVGETEISGMATSVTQEVTLNGGFSIVFAEP